MKVAATLVVVLAAAGCKKKQEAGARAVATDAAAPVIAKDAAAAGDDGGEAPRGIDAQPGAMPEGWWTTGCPAVLQKIGECAGDPAFLDAVAADAEDFEEKESILALAKGARTWSAPGAAKALCAKLPSLILDEDSFLDDTWTRMAEPDALESCEAIGVAVNEHGGLFAAPP